MGNFINYIWIALLIIYIISPFDAHPLFFDDLIASGMLFYYLYKNSRRKKQYEQYYSHHSRDNSSDNSRQNKFSGSQGPATLKEAYRLLGLNQNASLDELNRAYKLKIAKSHPDKVSHLSEELQDRAKELTLRLNEAFDLIKRHRGK
jgi:hypothetical protein